MNDTAPAAAQVQDDAIRRLDPIQRLIQALELSESMRALALSRLRQTHAIWTDVQLVELLVGATLIPPSRVGPAA